ncbi:hypothetical protein QQG55_50185 [Brugia pahangi]
MYILTIFSKVKFVNCLCDIAVACTYQINRAQCTYQINRAQCTYQINRAQCTYQINRAQCTYQINRAQCTYQINRAQCTYQINRAQCAYQINRAQCTYRISDVAVITQTMKLLHNKLTNVGIRLSDKKFYKLLYKKKAKRVME